MYRSLRIGLVCAFVLPLFSFAARSPVLARGCNPAFAPGGYIGQKWTAFGGASSALGCPTVGEHNYDTSTYFGTTPVRGRSQEFEHGQITWYPALGPKMTLSTWWNGASKMHVDFSDVATNPPQFVVEITNLAGDVGRTFAYPGGPGHSRDIALPSGMNGSTGLWIRLFACANDAKGLDCPPHMIDGQTIGKTTLRIESPSDAPVAVSNELNAGQVAGSLASNAPAPDLPESIHFDTPILRFNNGAPMDGWSHVTLHRDGRTEFESHFHDSGGVDYYYSLSWAIAASDGTMFTLHRSGKCEGHVLGSGGRDDDQDPTLKANPAIAAHWAALAKASVGRARADVNPNFGSLYDTLSADIQDVKQVVQTAEEVYETVTAVVAIVS